MEERLSSVECFLLDMDGTFNLGDRLLPGSLRFVEALKKQSKGYLFLTNNSSHVAGDYAAKMSRLGLPTTEGEVFTSGEATARYLLEQGTSRKLFVVGTPALEEEFRRYGFEPAAERPQQIVLGFDTTLTYAKLWRLCDLVREGIPYLATHPDFNCPTEHGYMPDTGAMIAFVRASTGREPDLVIGKPNRTIVDMAARKLGVPIERMAMVGDRLYTDIALGQTSGIATVLVLSGEATRSDLERSSFRPDYVFEDLGGLADWIERHGRPLPATSHSRGE
ncbi:MAG TPA: HAD-IIA family hydrolase [Anaerolineales bacterium]|nr:HAD-IIA family hydrolase [Anaerolineales bacterium]